MATVHIHIRCGSRKKSHEIFIRVHHGFYNIYIKMCDNKINDVIINHNWVCVCNKM